MLTANKIYGILTALILGWFFFDNTFFVDEKAKFMEITETDSIIGIVDNLLMKHEETKELDSLKLDSLAQIANKMKFSATDVSMIREAMEHHETEAIKTAIELATMDSTIYRYHYIDSMVVKEVQKEIVIYDTIHEQVVVYDTLQGTGWKLKRKRRK